MARTGVGLQPQPTEGEHNDNILMANPMAGAYVELPAHRYRLKAPTFTGNEDVEQFIQEFSDVADVAQWSPKVALMQLRMAPSRSLQARSQRSRHFCWAEGPFWHLRCGRQDPNTTATARPTHHPLGSCGHHEEVSAGCVR